MKATIEIDGHRLYVDGVNIETGYMRSRFYLISGFVLAASNSLTAFVSYGIGLIN